jgi:flavin reductase (DIM6/NTAB) family NADH-FMN oxidoreductase RutF
MIWRRTLRRALKTLKRMLLGPIDFPQKIELGLEDPQSEVDVWLHGLGDRLNVTQTHLMACGAPFTICIGFAENYAASVQFNNRLALRFQEHSGAQRFIGEIGLRFVSSLRVGTRQLCLFRMADYKNRSVSPLRLWTLYLQYSKIPHSADVRITERELRAVYVFNVCPRPVALVSVVHEDSANLFPMDLMGSVGDGYFAFALTSSKAAAPLVERAGRVVLSSVPFEQAAVATKLGANHRKSSINWNELPFPMMRPGAIDALVPSFALRAREMKVEAVHPLGSHTLFVARTIADEHFGDGLQLFNAHGTCKLWINSHTQHHSSRDRNSAVISDSVKGSIATGP